MNNLKSYCLYIGHLTSISVIFKAAAEHFPLFFKLSCYQSLLLFTPRKIAQAGQLQAT